VVTVAATERARPEHPCWAIFDEAVRQDSAAGMKNLRRIADAIGGTTALFLAQSRYVAKQWPNEEDRTVVPWNILAALAPREDRYELKDLYAAWPPFMAWRASDDEEDAPPVEDFLDSLAAPYDGQHR